MAYLSALCQALTQPLVQLEKEGIPQVIGTMQVRPSDINPLKIVSGSDSLLKYCIYVVMGATPKA